MCMSHACSGEGSALLCIHYCIKISFYYVLHVYVNAWVLMINNLSCASHPTAHFAYTYYIIFMHVIPLFTLILFCTSVSNYSFVHIKWHHIFAI